MDYTKILALIAIIMAAIAILCWASWRDNQLNKLCVDNNARVLYTCGTR